MGNSKYLDGLSQDEKNALVQQLWNIQNHKCFICGEEIDLDIQTTNIDHIKPLANGGKDEPVNFAITHEHCNKSKQDADLEVAKRLYALEKIIDAAEQSHETPSLKHVLLANRGSKYLFKYKIEENQIIYSFDDNGDTTIRKSEIFTDVLSGEKTAFINVPLAYLYHDEVVNPRGINSSIRLLIKEFYKSNPQLHLSLARIEDEKIKIFDGQHKAVAQIVLGVKSILVRLFINPDLDRLIETNTNAGSKLKQIAFDKAIVRQLHDTLYSERLRKYQQDHFLGEDNFSFSEQNLVDYFKGERGNIKLYIINSQKNAITRSPDNKLQSYINFEGRGNSLPLSYSTFEKTFLATFVNPKTILQTPINYRVDEGMNPRVLEKDQLIKLCNILAEEILIGKYDTEKKLLKMLEDVDSGDTQNIEGQSAKIYFEKLFRKGFNRNLENVYNACLDYGYSILRGAIARTISQYGYIPCLGIHHKSELNNYNLADDFIEPFRALVDLWTIQNVKETEEFNANIRRNLVDLLNYEVIISGKRVCVSNAIEIFVSSFTTSVQSKDYTKLQVPIIIPLERHIYG